MAMLLVIDFSVLVITFCLIHPTQTATVQLVQPRITGNEDWDYYYLVQRWPGTECNFTRCHLYAIPISPFHYMQVSGLWPNRNDGSYPAYCNGPKFDPDRLIGLRPELERIWPDLEKRDPRAFWAHEWNKHGTCASNDPKCSPEHKYFNTSVQLAIATNLVDTLSASGIVPGAYYSIHEIQKAVQARTGTQVTIGCYRGDFLHTINICFSKNLKYINCSKPVDESCNSSTLYFPLPPKY